MQVCFSYFGYCIFQQVNRPLTMKKEGIQTRNRKISTKLKKSSSCNRDPCFGPSNFKFFENPGTLAAAYTGPFGQMSTFGGVHPHHHPHMPHHLTSSGGFPGGHHILQTPHHPMHPSHPGASVPGSGTLALGINHPNMVHAMG